MSKQKTSEHMSRFKLKGDNLPPLQTLIVLYLAENEPKTINEIASALKKGYKSVYRSFDSLQKKKLVSKVDIKKYKGNEFPLFWLTDEGIISALIEGADQSVLLENVKKIFPDVEIVHCFLEVIQHMNPMMLNLAHSVIKNKGTMDFVDLITVLVSDSFETEEKTMKHIVSVLKKYPEQYEQMKILIKAIIEKLNQLITD